MAERTFEAVIRVGVEVEGPEPSLDDLRDALEESVTLDLDTEEGTNVVGESQINALEVDWESLRPAGEQSPAQQLIQHICGGPFSEDAAFEGLENVIDYDWQKRLVTLLGRLNDANN